MNDKLAFLTAPRFWAMVAGAVALYLKSKGIFGDSEMILIATITAGFVGIGTIDRMADKQLEGMQKLNNE